MTGRNGLTVSSIPLLRDVRNFSPVPPPTPPGPPGGGVFLPIIAAILMLFGLGPVLVAPPGPPTEEARPAQAVPSPVESVQLGPTVSPPAAPAPAIALVARQPGPVTQAIAPAPPGQRLAVLPRPEVLPYGGANLWIPGAGSAVLLGSGLLLRSYSGRARVRRRGTDGLPVSVGGLRLASSALVAAGLLVAFASSAWVASSARAAESNQTAALASWEHGAAGSKPAAVRHAPPPAGLVLTVPRLGLRRFVPEGATSEQLREFGLGRISWTSLPGEDGTLGIAGHRTTYGAPFFRLNAMRPGDVIYVDYQGYRYQYAVTGSVVVTPERTDVLEPTPGTGGIALVTCTPVFSAARRLVVQGEFQSVSPLPSRE